ncbi:MAG: thermonuclease family protein [Planctomycetota bacterium]|nr:thermonuclease family protein [Planctomycetota bacterium]
MKTYTSMAAIILVLSLTAPGISTLADDQPLNHLNRGPQVLPDLAKCSSLSPAGAPTNLGISGILDFHLHPWKRVQSISKSMGILLCNVIRVVDGDTIKIPYRGRTISVRYIGVDTPETVHPNRPVEPYGKEAASLNRKLLTSGTVFLELDLEQFDRYRRLLAYVYTVQDGKLICVNEELLRLGHARARFYPPNTRYRQRFLSLEHNARVQGLGIWSLADSAPSSVLGQWGSETQVPMQGMPGQSTR